MQEVYSVKASIQWLYDGFVQDYKVKTLAQSKEDAEMNIRDRFRTAYYVKIKEID